MIDLRRDYAWLALAFYVMAAIAVPGFALLPERDAMMPPITPLVLADNPDVETMMTPLRQQANAALQSLQKAPLQEAAAASF